MKPSPKTPHVEKAMWREVEAGPEVQKQQRPILGVHIDAMGQLSSGRLIHQCFLMDHQAIQKTFNTNQSSCCYLA